MKEMITTEKIPIKLWLDHIDDNALQQAKNLANLDGAYKWIAIMPDCHQGYGMPIGGVLAMDGLIVPNAVGVDIGCGMSAIKTSLTEIDSDLLHSIVRWIKTTIPLGFEHHTNNQDWRGFFDAPDIFIIQSELDSARKQLGTLGSGNHFIEIQKGDDGHIWFMLHSGSRNFGLKTAQYYQKIAKEICTKKKRYLPDMDLAYLEFDSHDGNDYFKAMNYCCDFAFANRDLMMKRICEYSTKLTGMTVLQEINIHHNYAAIEEHYQRQVIVHRKGATKAESKTTGIIPGSMGSTSYIVRGLGNTESFFSCSHGAGRRMGRKEAERSLNLLEEQKKMSGIIHGLHSRNNLDEAPGAYKDIKQVMENQKDLVQILVNLVPLASIKG